MVRTQSSTLTFADYLAYADGTDTRYELVRGHLIAMTPPTGQHLLIARYLERMFTAAIEASDEDWIALQGTGQKVSEETSRSEIPDLYQILSVYPRFVGALHCNAPYEVSISNRGCVTRICIMSNQSTI
jgi:Uma2 family endonuclease